MAALNSYNDTVKTDRNNLISEYYWYYSNIYKKFQKTADDFFKQEFQLRFMGISFENNILFYGDEYFVNKIPVNKVSSIVIRISSNLVSSFLDSALGNSEVPFELKKLTDIEAMLIKSFTLILHKNIEEFLNKAEASKKTVQSSFDYNFTFFVKNKSGHTGKIILTIPEFLLPEIKPAENPEKFTMADFKKTTALLNISAGSAKIALNDVKNIEIGDIIVLDDSDINKMIAMWDNEKIKFKITPNPSLIISVENNGGGEMEEQTGTKSQNMWDSILVDIVAEFDNVKFTLGELKQISEGLVIDLGSIYDNKIKLRVENQVVATGELVILNDRYAVRIDSVKKSKEETAKPAVSGVTSAKTTEVKKPAAAKPNGERPIPSRAAAAKRPVKPAAQQQPKPDADTDENENFDYSDFEIEDESI